MDVEASQAPILEIAHVLFTDIVAYSALPVDKQRKAVRHLQEAITGTSDYGRFLPRDQLIVLPTGDGAALVFFRDVEAPVRCAIELAARLQSDAQLRVRMGIHTGPVYRVADINANRNVAGGGINIAQRVMDVGDAGHILVSKTVAEMLSEVSTWRERLHDLGEAEVKHGAHVHLYNLYTETAGNPNIPTRLSGSSGRPAARRLSESSGRPTSLDPGLLIAHYRITQRVGGGGMGVVYEAEDVRLGRRVALKFLPEHLLEDPQAIERFQREARAASALNHPNICTVYDVGEHDRLYYIAMELLEGSTVRSIIQQRAATLKRVVRWGVQITDALATAHDKGIVHRDLKPTNIFVTFRDDVKILDFGLAKITLAQSGSTDERATELTQPGMQLGTIAYMSPEQARGEAVDARSDLFSVGMVLYELLTGKSPFPGDTPAVITDGIMNRVPVDIVERNPEVPLALQDVIERALQKRPEDRYQSAHLMHHDLEALSSLLFSDASKEALKKLESRRRKQYRSASHRAAAAPAVTASRSAGMAHRSARFKAALAIVTAVLMVAGGIGLYLLTQRGHQLTDRDTIVLSDFTNTTGDPLFDDALKQGLAVQLEQSPFLSLISEHKVNDTLKMMGRSPEDRLTPAVTREVCQRTGSTIMLTGSISGLGKDYVVGLQAVNCASGEVVAETQQEAAGKDAVLRALNQATNTMRGKLGESVSSLKKYGTSLEQATTPSLEALQAFSMGKKISLAQGINASLPFYKGAVELDPKFARAYLALGLSYEDVNQPGLAAENTRKAYELRDKVSERERFAIEAGYYLMATGELEKAEQAYRQWGQTYPRDPVPYEDLGFVYSVLGDREKALDADREATRLNPDNGVNYANLGVAHVNFNRLDDAAAAYNEAEKRGLKAEILLWNRYLLAFLKNDPAQMAQLAASATGTRGMEHTLLFAQSDTAAWYGKYKDARTLTQRASLMADQNGSKETAAIYRAAGALREAGAGDTDEARADAKAALHTSSNQDVRSISALALACAGDTQQADKLAGELDKAHPLSTLVQKYWLPSIRAAIALQHKEPERAIELLKVTVPFELSQPTQANVFLIPVYLRGQSYLMMRDGRAAAGEFQKFIDYRGLVANFPWASLARLQMARAQAIEAGNNPSARGKARESYLEFLNLWNEADPDIPIFKQAKVEFAKV